MDLATALLLRYTIKEPCEKGKAHESREVTLDLSTFSKKAYLKFKKIAQSEKVLDWDDSNKKRVMIVFKSTLEAELFKLSIKDFIKKQYGPF